MNKFLASTGFYLLAMLLMSERLAARPTQKQTHDKIGQDTKSCEARDKIGQMLYVNVDDFGPGKSTIDPAYIAMVKELNIGGVLTHTLDDDSANIKKATDKLQSATQLPLFISVDHLDLATADKKESVTIGMGTAYLAAFLRNADAYDPDCLSARAYLDAFLHRAVGLNQALGPMLDRNSSNGLLGRDAQTVGPYVDRVTAEFAHFGVAGTAKHFPYTPESFDSHKQFPNTKNSEEDVLRRLNIFKRVAPDFDFVMTTHLYNSNIDADDMATFSKKWMGLLKENVGTDKLIMTDGLFMIDSYAIQRMSAKWPKELAGYDNHTIFAARAILAGHDIVYLEGDSGQTKNTFNELIRLACSDHLLGQALLARIQGSYNRIATYKADHAKLLRPNVEVPQDLVDSAIRLYVPLSKDHNKANADKKTCVDWEKFNLLKAKIEVLGFPEKTLPAKGEPPTENQNAKSRG